MAQGVISHLTYERLGVLVSDFPAYKTTPYTSGDLMRVQSLNFGFSHPAIDVKAVGSDVLMTKDGNSPIVRQPDVTCEIDYIFTSGENESDIGFHLGSDASVFKKYFEATTTDDINIVAIASNSNSHIDLNKISDVNSFSGYNVIGFGNCFLSNYSYSAAVGQLPNASLSYSCSNMKFDTYIPGEEPFLPSVNLSDGSTFSTEPIKLTENSFGQNISGDYPGGILPGDIVVTITKGAGDYGGVPLESVFAAIQNVNINVPIDRQDIYGFGSNYVYDRKPKYPIIGTLSTDMIIRQFATGQLDSFFTQGTRYDVLIENRKRNPDGTFLQVSTFSIEDAQLKSQSYSKSIGDSSSVQSQFSFGIGASGGLKLYNP